MKTVLRFIFFIVLGALFGVSLRRIFNGHEPKNTFVLFFMIAAVCILIDALWIMFEYMYGFLKRKCR